MILIMEFLLALDKILVFVHKTFDISIFNLEERSISRKRWFLIYKLKLRDESVPQIPGTDSLLYTPLKA
jgi:hypothetical protein